MATLLILTTAFCVWLALKAQPAYQRDGTAGLIEAFTGLIFLGAVAIGRWKVFDKAGQPGWGAVVPIYNHLLLLRVAQRPSWWIILYVIPLLNLIPLVLVPLDIARRFGKSGLFGAGLIFLGFVFYPLLGFGSSLYRTPTHFRFHAGKPYVC